MSKEIDRRDFIGVIFGTVSTAAISGPLQGLWPAKAKDRPAAEPIVFTLEHGYVIDPDFEPTTTCPTVSQNRYENLDEEDQVSFLLEWLDELEELGDKHWCEK
ncbi:MAG: hypothetical protein HOI66_15355 [Verrucomicrobia bacterium]|jgi:hypothetical protein|nr:hypothetical protein [Verrucomicrobiota bacterium]